MRSMVRLANALLINAAAGLFSPAQAEVPAEPPIPPLVIAAKAADLEKVKTLLAEGADIEAGDNSHRTALNWAAYNGSLDVAKALLAHHASVDVHANPDGWTPLMNASAMGYLDMAALLWEHGADINAHSTKEGYTPLMYAARKGRKYLVEFLLDHDARVNDMDKIKRTALDFSDMQEDASIRELLIKRGGIRGPK